MNRQIKFRAWDSEANIMIYSDHRTRKLYDAYYGFEMNEKGELECWWEGDFSESHVLDGGILDNIMQYTGLKDKNGVEIYEGDILKGQIVRNYQRMAVVKFIDGAFRFVELEELGLLLVEEDNPLTLDYYYNLEVIGNAFEDSHLLEGVSDAES